MQKKSEDTDDKKKIKIVVIGGPNVGKTSIINRFVSHQFNSFNSPTIQLAMTTFEYKLEDQIFTLLICDTAGQEQFQSVCPNFYRDAQGAIIVFDITDRKSFDKMQDWVNELNASLTEPIPIVIAGNKVDLEENRVIQLDEAVEYSDQSDINYFETSALSDFGIDNLFSSLVSQIISKEGDSPDETVNNVNLASPSSPKSSCC